MSWSWCNSWNFSAIVKPSASFKHFVHLSPEEGIFEDTGDIDFNMDPQNKDNVNHKAIKTQTTGWESLPEEILEKIVFYTITTASYQWPYHVCQVYQNLRRVDLVFCYIVESLTDHFSQIYCQVEHLVPKPKNVNVVVSVIRLIRLFDSCRGIMIELKCIIAWLSLCADPYSWYVIENIFWKKWILKKWIFFEQLASFVWLFRGHLFCLSLLQLTKSYSF